MNAPTPPAPWKPRLPPTMAAPMGALQQQLRQLTRQHNSRAGSPVNSDVHDNLHFLHNDLELLADGISKHHGQRHTLRPEIEEALRHASAAIQALHAAYRAKFAGKDCN